MASSLPAFPRFLFTVFEPLSLVAGFLGTVVDTAWFLAEQLPHTAFEPTTEHSIVVTRQLGNLYLLMAFMGVAILCTTSEIKVVRAYLIALALGDIGHVAISCYGLGLDGTIHIHKWNSMAWGNVATTLFLFCTRVSYLFGLFGPDKAVSAVEKKKD